MAIYSCNLKSIGRTTHEAGTAGAHIRYISRPDAEPDIMSMHMPDEPVTARTWLDTQERGMRKNARVIDKLRIALPRELSDEQRADLVCTFMAELTGNNVPWYAAIHQTGKDAHNPHVHIALHDRDVETRKRVLRLSDSTRDRRKAGLPGPKAVDWVRERWEVACNQALHNAGILARIDRRSLEDQGVDRLPTIHEGPRAQHINDNVKRPASQERVNGCGRVINYPFIDQGRTRREFNAHIIDINLAKAARSQNGLTALWAQFEREQIALDDELEKQLKEQRRKQTTELRLASLKYLAVVNRLRAERNLKMRAAARQISEKYDKRRQSLRADQGREREALKNRQSRLHIRIFAFLDFTGITRRRMEAARKALSAEHKRARRTLSGQYHEVRGHAEQAVKERYEDQIAHQQKQRMQHLAQLNDRYAEAEGFADHDRQAREAEREHMRLLTERKIEEWKQRQKSGETCKVQTSFADAVMKAAKDQAKSKASRDKGKDRDLDRER